MAMSSCLRASLSVNPRRSRSRKNPSRNVPSAVARSPFMIALISGARSAASLPNSILLVLMSAVANSRPASVISRSAAGTSASPSSTAASTSGSRSSTSKLSSSASSARPSVPPRAARISSSPDSPPADTSGSGSSDGVSPGAGPADEATAEAIVSSRPVRMS